MTDEQQAWTAAWIKAWAELGDIGKNQQADLGTYSYSYADLSAVLAGIKPVLTKHDLAVSQSVTGEAGGISVETRITHKDGWTETYGPTFVPFTGDARAAGSAITYARRYGLIAALGIATDDDTDAAPVQKSLHDEAWRVCYETHGADAAEASFAAALLAEGITDDARIETDEQYDAVIRHVKGTP